MARLAFLQSCKGHRRPIDPATAGEANSHGSNRALAGPLKDL